MNCLRQVMVVGAVLTAAATGCGDNNSAVGGMGQIEMRVSTAPSDVAAIHVSVTAQDIQEDISSDLVLAQDGTWSGTVMDVPPGLLRTVTAVGADLNHIVIFEGSTSNVSVFSGMVTPVTVTLLPFPNNGGGTGINTPPHFAQLGHPDAMNTNATTELMAMALDPDNNALLTYTWSSTPSGTFSDDNIDGDGIGNIVHNQRPGDQVLVQYTPETDFTGFAVIQVDVSDGQASATTTFTIAVGAGIDPNIGFDVLPDLQIISVDRQVLMPRGSTGISYTLTNPGTQFTADPMHLHTLWSDNDCGGQFDIPIATVDVARNVSAAESVTYTASPNVPAGLSSCSLRLTVVDDSGASIWTGVFVWIEEPLMAFVTSGTVDGAFFAGQSAAADAYCQGFADHAGVSPGVYKALLSFDELSAKDRIIDGPYIKFDGTAIARSKAELFGTHSAGLHAGTPDTFLLSAIDHDENNEPVEGNVFTGTNPDGTRAADQCNNWTSNTSEVSALEGLTLANDVNWTASGTFSCDQPAHVYCFQQFHERT